MKKFLGSLLESIPGVKCVIVCGSNKCCFGESWNVCVCFVSLIDSNDRVLVGPWNCHENRFPQRHIFETSWGNFETAEKQHFVTDRSQRVLCYDMRYDVRYDMNDAAVFSTVTSQQESSWVKFRLGPFLCGVWTTLENKKSELPPTVQRHVNWWF